MKPRLRVSLIHWNAAEGDQRAAELQSAGFDAERFTPQGGNLKPLRDHPPDLLIIDLTRLPSHGREVAAAVRRSSATRNVPMLFAGGDPAKVARVRELLPDATYTGWNNVVDTIRSAGFRTTAGPPVVPAAMQGYANSSLVQKLGIKPHTTLTLINAPDAFEEVIELPSEVTVRHKTGQMSHRVLLFVERLADLQRWFTPAETTVSPEGGLWIIWPKQSGAKSSGTRSDLSEPLVRRFATELGWVDYKVCSVDAKWSGLLFARKKG